jgi:hypothetical protein
VTSSPLKPKAKAPIIHDMESEPDLDGRPSEPPAEPEPEPELEDLPEELRAKKETVRNLREELDFLKWQTEQVESAMQANDLPADPAENSALFEIINSGYRLATVTDKDTEQESTTKDHEPPFANLFAPGNLQLSTKTSTKIVKGNAKVVHQVLVAAPPPWSSDLFRAKFEVVTDAEDACVEKITWVDTLKGHRQAAGIQDEIHDWIKERLGSELHRRDLSGLIWGLGQYFDASVARARAFRTLKKNYMVDEDTEEEQKPEQTPADADKQEVTEAEALALAQYLTISQLTLEIPDDDEDDAAPANRTRSAKPSVIVSWNLQPQWHGPIKPKFNLAMSGVSDGAQKAVVELLDKTIKIDGFERGFGYVWDMVLKAQAERQDDEEFDDVGEEGVRGRRKKRKRVT